MLTKVEECVSRGVKLLDKENPHWRGKIDPLKLDMAESDFCILGQLYGDFETGYSILNVKGEDTSCYGFDGCDYDSLTEAWLNEIQMGSSNVSVQVMAILEKELSFCEREMASLEEKLKEMKSRRKNAKGMIKAIKDCQK